MAKFISFVALLFILQMTVITMGVDGLVHDDVDVRLVSKEHVAYAGGEGNVYNSNNDHKTKKDEEIEGNNEEEGHYVMYDIPYHVTLRIKEQNDEQEQKDEQEEKEQKDEKEKHMDAVAVAKSPIRKVLRMKAHESLMPYEHNMEEHHEKELAKHHLDSKHKLSMWSRMGRFVGRMMSSAMWAVRKTWSLVSAPFKSVEERVETEQKLNREYEHL